MPTDSELLGKGSVIGGITAWAVASNATESARIAATSAKARYGEFVQICDGTADDVQIQAAIDALPS